MPKVNELEGDVVALPENYQHEGGGDQHQVVDLNGTLREDEASDEFDRAASVEAMDVATVDNWLLDDTPIEEWVPLKRRGLKVKLRAITEETRQDIDRRAPRKMNKKTKQPEADQNWINLEIVRLSLVEPAVADRDMLKKALAGELAYLAGEIGKLSGFDMSEADALG